MFIRIPIVAAMAIPAIAGIIYLKGPKALLAAAESVVWDHSFNYTLSTIPLFVLMGQLLFAAGMSDELFDTFRSWFGRLKGGLAMATIGSSAMFAASTGSSLATTGTIGVIASKEMLKSGYAKSLTGGSIVAGGTLGILIPPSTMFIIYGMMTEQSIGKLLIAGIIPGILLTLLFMLTISIAVKVKPGLVTEHNQMKVGLKAKMLSLRSNIWIIVLFVAVIGGIYTGIFTATEAAGVGSFGAFLIALFRRKLTVQKFKEAILDTLETTGFLFAIIIGAFLLNYVLTITRVPNLLADAMFSQNLSGGFIFLLIVVLFFILGAVMESLAMVVVAIPIVLPLVEKFGFDLIWFGVIIVLLVETALISPPVGMNCFVLKGICPDFDMKDIFKGATLFIIPIMVLIALLYFFPDIALFLPNTVK